MQISSCSQRGLVFSQSKIHFDFDTFVTLIWIINTVIIMTTFLMGMKVLMMIWNIMTMMIHCAIIVWYCRSSCRRIVWYSFSVQYILLLMRWPWGNDEKDQYHDILLMRMEHWDGLVFPLSALHALHNLHNCSDILSCKIFHCLMTISNLFTFHIYLDF